MFTYTIKYTLICHVIWYHGERSLKSLEGSQYKVLQREIEPNYYIRNKSLLENIFLVINGNSDK